MIQYKKIKQISPELTLSYYNQIPVLELNHPHLGEAKVALQGAQLLSWKPKSEQQDILWLSPIEPFFARASDSRWDTYLLPLVWCNEKANTWDCSFSVMETEPF
ncbi:aldose 1-epimerase [Pasteurella multocida]|nr:aldose 1-epimerase [Pasteurella multocida]